MKATIIAVALVSLACVCTAAASPASYEPHIPGSSDRRIHIEEYDPNRVVTIYTAPGNPTLIQFESDERIVDTPSGMIGMGDGKAWSIGPKGSNIMLKPIAKQPDTKLLVVTTKRTYAFDIKSIPDRSDIEPTLIVRFNFPDSRANLTKAEAARKDAISQRLAQTGLKDGTSLARNRKYMKRGDESLAPSQVEDDGRFTFMRFDSTRELPVVYKLLPDGREALTNFHMDSDSGTMVIHETAANFILRYGKAVMAIRNDGFRPDGALDRTGSTLPGTIRMEREVQ
jgi:type IV secretion system protein VirB9